MKIHFLRSITLAGLFIAFILAGGAAATQTTTIALVPKAVAVSPDDPGRNKAFLLKPGTTATLTFDVGCIPGNVEIKSVVLRLVNVPDSNDRNNQMVLISPASNPSTSIGQLTMAATRTDVESKGVGLRDQLVRIGTTSANPELSLVLTTKSTDTSKSYYSDRALTSRNRPRLIVEWTDMAGGARKANNFTSKGPELRYRGNPDDMTPWKNDKPNGAMLSVIFQKDQILAGPVFRGDEILLIARPQPSAAPILYGIDWMGKERWNYPSLPGLKPTSSWKYLHLDDRGRLVAFANDEIWLFEFGDTGGPIDKKSKPVDGLNLSKRPVVDAGGMVTFLNTNGYVYSLSPAPSLDELWKSDIVVGKAPPPVPSPRNGDSLVYVLAVDDNAQQKGLGFYAFDALRGTLRFPPPKKPTPAFPTNSTLANFPGFHPPFAVAGPDHDWVFLSGFKQSAGVLEGYSDFTRGDPNPWRDAKNGPVSRSIAPPGLARIYCVQNGQLCDFKLDGTDVRKSTVNELAATSNLLADGGGNIYFWNEAVGASGVFYGFNNHGGQFFGQSFPRLPANKNPEGTPVDDLSVVGLPAKQDGSDVLEIRAGPNGVFYAASDKRLFAIQPTTTPPAGALAAETRYATRESMTITAANTFPTNGPVILAAVGGRLSWGNIQIPAGADVTCSAGTGMSFSQGFTVKQGGVLRCGIAKPATQ